MKKKLTYILLIILSLATLSNAFNIRSDSTKTNLSVKFGLVNTALKDEYISKQKYSDSFPFIDIGFSQQWAGRINEINLSHGNTETMSNGIINSWYEYTSLGINLLYPLDILPENNSLALYLGPHIGYFDYYFSHSFALLSGYESEGSLLSLGISSKLRYRLYHKIQVEAATEFSIISITEKTFDNQKYPEFDGNSELTTFFESGILNTDIKIILPVFYTFNLSAGYDWKYIWIGNWDNYVALNNFFFIELGYGF